MSEKSYPAINLPVISLIAANLVPLFGVLFAGWDLFAILILFWSENIIIGFYNILKIATAKVNQPVEHLGKLFIIPFFSFHYGMFCFVHGIFISSFFNQDKMGFDPFSGISWPERKILLGIAVLFISHGISFAVNYIIKDERSKTNIATLMGAPYARIFILQIAIIFGGFFIMFLNSPVFMLIILIILKIGFDISLHRAQHMKFKVNFPQSSAL